MRLVFWLLTAASTGLALPALAAETVSAASEAPPVKARKLCRTLVGTGSIMPKRTCRTAQEWAEIDQRNSDQADKDLSDRQRNQTSQTDR